MQEVSKISSAVRRFAIIIVLASLACGSTQAQADTYTLGTATLLVGPSAGLNSVVLAVAPSTAVWTAAANDPWLRLDLDNQSGTGSTNVVFSYDANPGGTRSGSLTIGGETLPVIQAGSTYVAAGVSTTIVGAGANSVAVDSFGNVYIGVIPIKEWTPTNDTVQIWASANRLLDIKGIALDGAGNVYFADPENVVWEWTATTKKLVILASHNGLEAYGVAVDGNGNVYFSDILANVVSVWMQAESNTVTLVSGLNGPQALALDAIGNLYIADFYNNAIKRWTAANSNVVTVLSAAYLAPQGVAVDGSGNLYVVTFEDHVLKQSAATGSVTTLFSGLDYGTGVAVDSSQNVYVCDYESIHEIPHAFVDPTSKLEGLAAGADALPAVLPVTENLFAPFAPSSDQPWLTITGITNGVVGFSFTANPGPARSAHINLLGQSISITQGVIGAPPILNAVQLDHGALQFVFSNTPNAAFTVRCATNLSLPLARWTVLGAPSNTAPGIFHFKAQPAPGAPQTFYNVSSP